MHGHVLIVDDDYDIRTSLRDLLEEEGYQASVVENGARAVERLRGGDAPCVILLDLMMPVMDGWTFLDRRRSDPALSSIPVVVLTAADEPLFPEGLPAGHCLRKPIDLPLVLEMVERYCALAAGRVSPAG